MEGRILFAIRRKRKTIALLSLLLLVIAATLLNRKERILYRYLPRFNTVFPGAYTGHDHDEEKAQEMIKRQKCTIPKLDPFHPEIRPYLPPAQIDGCRLKQYAVVEKGILYLKVKDVVAVSVYYIRRVDDFKIALSDRITLMGNAKLGQECWKGCNEKGGECPSFCGEGGFCCRKGFDECPGNISVTTDYHGCIYHDKMARDITYPMKEEFLKLEIQFSGTTHVEYHFAFLKTGETKGGKELRDQLNIIMIMFDSVSYSYAQRSLKKTLEYLKKHPRNVFMTGQTICGDGTTANLCAMLTGISEGELPEARRGFPNSTAVDRWPFIFKQLHKRNYKTVFSEEDPIFAMFNYRLHGFSKIPTTHYLRPLWMAMNIHLHKHGVSCAHRFHIEYIKRFFNAYKESNKFAFVFNMITHNKGHLLGNVDDDILNLYKEIMQSEFAQNTVIFLAGDHGLRTSQFRATLHGKMEERLPLLSITVPSSFDAYPTEMKHLRHNAQIMTSHYDVYSTLRHLLEFPHLNPSDTRKYGKSLFSDISKLNRTCSDAGVAMHWCTCLKFEPVSPTSDPNVLSVVTNVINYVNELNAKAGQLCSTLKLRSIIRAGRRTPNTEVNQFVGTGTKTGGCDSCEPRYNKGLKFSRYQYEIHFSVSPSGGEYEVSGEVFLKNNGEVQITFNTEISRTNLYGDQPSCVAEKYPHLRKYCYCRTPT